MFVLLSHGPRLLLRTPAATLLAIVTVAIGFGMVAWTAAVEAGVGGVIDIHDAPRTLVVLERGSVSPMTSRLPHDALRLVRPIPHVRSAVPVIVHVAASRADGRAFAIYGVDPGVVPEQYPLPLSEGARQNWRNDVLGAVCGRAIAARLGLEAGQDLVLDQAGAIRVKLQHVYNTPGSFEDAVIFVHRAHLERCLGVAGQCSLLHVLLDDPAHADEVARAIDTRLADQQIASTTRPVQDSLRLAAGGVARDRQRSRALPVLAVAILILVLVATRMHWCRRNEPLIAVLFAVGYRMQHLILVFIVQHAILGVVGCVLGVIVIAATVGYADGALGTQGVLVTPIVLPVDLITIAVFAIAATTATAIAPTLRTLWRLRGNGHDRVLRHVTDTGGDGV